ncbi:MAG TPA: hypothetical protein G4O20_00805 [Dehalococcoidia bacterium]|nr:hypothetical protein [Dehalococcoidia bacterium]
MARANNRITETELVKRESIIDDDYKQRIARFLEREGDSIRKEADQESAFIISRAREEYIQRLSRFLEEEGEKIRKQAERDAENVITKAREEKENVFAEARNMAKSQVDEVVKKVKMQAEQTVAMYANIAKQRAEKIADEYRDECKKRAEQEAATIIDNANEQAIQIIAQAKERANKQADEEKQEEAKRIMESARLEAAEIIEKAKQAAEKEAEETASKIISLAQQKAEQIISKTMEKLRNGEEEELAKLMSEAKYKSERETTDIFAEVEREAEQLIKKVINDTNGQGEAANEDTKIEDMEEIEFAVEAREEVKEPRKSEAMSDSDQWEEIMPVSREQKAEGTMEVEGETATVISEEEMRQPEDEPTLAISEAAPAEEDNPAEAEEAESSETFVEAENLEIDEAESDTVGQYDESIYTGKVEIELDLSVDTDILSKLYNYLVNTPEIKLVKSVGSSGKGVIITMMLDKPIPLVETLSSKIPEAQVTGGPSGTNEKKHEARVINIARRGS